MRYRGERTQSGLLVGAFPANQRFAAAMASETLLPLAPIESAVMTAVTADDWTAPQVEYDIAVAKSIASAALSVFTSGAHQILEARGTTAEHPLHTVMLRAMAEPSEFGKADWWNTRIVQLVASAERSAVAWDMLTRVRLAHL